MACPFLSLLLASCCLCPLLLLVVANHAHDFLVVWFPPSFIRTISSCRFCISLVLLLIPVFWNNVSDFVTLSESYCHVYIPFSLTFYPFSQTEPTFCFQGKRMICESNEFCITICQSVIVLTIFSAITLLAGPPSLPTADARPRHVGFCVCSRRLWQTFCFQLKRMLCELTEVSISFCFTTYHVTCHYFVSRTTVVAK